MFHRLISRIRTALRICPFTLPMRELTNLSELAITPYGNILQLKWHSFVILDLCSRSSPPPNIVSIVTTRVFEYLYLTPRSFLGAPTCKDCSSRCVNAEYNPMVRRRDQAEALPVFLSSFDAL